jgi:hypothetical protein
MKRILRETLDELKYQGKRNDYQILKQYSESLPNQKINEIDKDIRLN